MNKEEVMRIANDCGIIIGFAHRDKVIVEFAQAIEVRTKEKCAELCMEIYGSFPTNQNGQKQNTARDCADAIRTMP